jgi:TPR repeat protein
MSALGFIYYDGDDVEQDYNEAYYWFKKDGFRDLPYFVYAEMCFFIDKDYANALNLYRAALQQGVEEASYKIGEMYYYGLGVEQDYTKALEFLKYYENEFDEDDFDFAPAKVHRMLGEMYLNGWGVEQNTEEAEKLFRAAEKRKDC